MVVATRIELVLLAYQAGFLTIRRSYDMVGDEGLEPPESNDTRFTVWSAACYGILTRVIVLEYHTGLEPVPSVWKTEVLANYTNGTFGWIYWIRTGTNRATICRAAVTLIPT